MQHYSLLYGDAILMYACARVYDYVFVNVKASKRKSEYVNNYESKQTLISPDLGKVLYNLYHYRVKNILYSK